MKPAFALSFSSEEILLHHQSDGDWFCVGTVSFDTQDLDASMRDLHQKAFALENDLSCQVVIPEDQIRYLTLDSEGLDDKARVRKAETALLEATPYSLSEISYDLASDEYQTYVCAVAKQTLEEASTFVVAHGFKPAIFTSSPSSEQFPIEPRLSLREKDETTTQSDESVDQVSLASSHQKAIEPTKSEEANQTETHVQQLTEQRSVSGPEEVLVSDDTTDAKTEPLTSAEPEKVSESSYPAVHPIAEPANPDTFSSPPRSGGGSVFSGSLAYRFGRDGYPGSNRIMVPAIAATIVLGLVFGSWSFLQQDAQSNTQATELQTASLGDPQPAPAPEEISPPEVTVVEEPEADATEPDDPNPADQIEIASSKPKLSETETIDTEGIAPGEVVAQEDNEAEFPEPPEMEIEASDPVEQTTAEVDEQPFEITDAAEPADLEQPALTATDAAILEALKVEPQTVEPIAVDPEVEQTRFVDAGIVVDPPLAPLAPPSDEPEADLYLGSVETSSFAHDAVALPDVSTFDTDAPVELVSLPTTADSVIEQNAVALVDPTEEGTLNPDGVMVYLGKPSLVPPEIPARPGTDSAEEESGSGLAAFRPKLRPEKLVENFERAQLGGRTREELAGLRPKLRPSSPQSQVKVDDTPTALAVVRVPRPKDRPASVVAFAANASAGGGEPQPASVAKVEDDNNEGSLPSSVAPKIPSSASVARQATLNNAINLRRLNLIGVYGTPANRRALVRLPSGRYRKLKVGDRIDGGKVIAIGDSELRYQKKGRNIVLKMPKG